MPLRAVVTAVYLYSGRALSQSGHIYTRVHVYTIYIRVYMFCNAPSPRAGWLDDRWTCSTVVERGCRERP